MLRQLRGSLIPGRFLVALLLMVTAVAAVTASAGPRQAVAQDIQTRAIVLHAATDLGKVEVAFNSDTVAEELECRLIVAFTESGSTARLVSSYRPHAPIAAITYNDDTYRRLALWWGVVPIRSNFAPDTDAMIVQGQEILKGLGLVRAGETILMLAGQTHTAGATNMLRVHTIT